MISLATVRYERREKTETEGKWNIKGQLGEIAGLVFGVLTILISVL